MTATDDPSPSPSGAPPPPPPARPRFSRAHIPEFVWRAAIFLIALAILVIITTRWNRWQGGAQWQVTDDAFIQSDLTPISAKVPGYIRAVPVQDFERVRAGQLIAALVDDDYKASVAQAEANLAAAK